MTDANWKSWGLIALIGLFLFTQLLRHLPMTQSVLPWDNDGFRLAKADQPYSVKDVVEHMHPRASFKVAPLVLHGGLSREQIQKFAAANAPVAAPTETLVAKADDKAKKTEEKCDEKNPKIDPKTGLAMVCKKKKTKEIPKMVIEEATPISTPPTDSSTPSASAVDTSVTPGVAPAIAPAVAPKSSDASMSLEDWQKLLLTTPDLTDTRRFIDDYNRSVVTAQIFYQIVEAMLADSRDDMKDLGILCAGMTPSVISFQLLTQVENTESSNSPVRANAEIYLTHYSDISYLSILQRVLQTAAVDYSTVAAEQRLDTSAQRYLTSTVNRTTKAVVKASARNITYFQRFVAVLTPLEKSSNASVAYQAKATLSNLQNLLTAATSTTTPPTTTVASVNTARD